jgi:hypothetical protein
VYWTAFQRARSKVIFYSIALQIGRSCSNQPPVTQTVRPLRESSKGNMKTMLQEYIDGANLETVGTAWQYKVRLEKSVSELKNPYWEGVSLSVKDATVKPVDVSFAKKYIVEYEWLACMPAIVRFCFGIFFDEVCGGVVVFGDEYSENTGVWDKYGYTGKMLLLARGVCLHWTPKNTNSKLIMSAIKQLPNKYEVITATTDNLAGEIGTIYQACNFHYVGSMRKNKVREGMLLNGKLYGSRSIRAKFGHQRKDEILELCPDAVFIKQKAKDRYFLFRNNTKQHLSSIAHLVKPYPKRGLTQREPDLKLESGKLSGFE